MVATRPWPKAPDGAVHLIGDTHFGSPEMSGGGGRRKNIWAADLANPVGMLPESVVHVVVGDLTDGRLVPPGAGAGVEDTEAVAFMDAAYGSGNWISAVGNHDVFGTRTPDQAAAAWGMPGANSVHDYDTFKIIRIMSEGIADNLIEMQPFTESRLLWLDSQLTAAGDTPCLIVCHWSLYDTVQAGYASSPSTNTGWYAYHDADIRAVLAEHHNAAAWLSGHTHSTLDLEGIVSAVPVGNHTVCAVNASSPAYSADGSGRSQLPTMYLTVTDNEIDVRFRDHGAGTWTWAGWSGTSAPRTHLITVPITTFTPPTGFGTSPFGTGPFGG